MKRLIFILILLLLATVSSQAEDAGSAIGNGPEFRVCSLNAHNLGMPANVDQRGKKKKANSKRDRGYLVQRIIDADCDVVALQEVYGENDKDAEQVLKNFSELLYKRGGVQFSGYPAKTRDERGIRNALLVKNSIGTVTEVDFFSRMILPKLQSLGPTKYFGRSPIGVVLLVKPKTSSKAKRFYLVGAHLKSKAEGWKDPMGLQFESTRVELAEGLRKAVLERASQLGSDVVPVIMLDRNSDSSSASAKVLSGEYQVNDFKRGGGCEIDEWLRPSCAKKTAQPVELEGVLNSIARSYPSNEFGSYRYKGKMELIDEILVRPNDYWMLKRSGGIVAAGFKGELGKGSDHKLLWGEFDW